ncbi:hypothetical protein V502_02630 [Pseudogymnoascus sp. VKM F-4520 (FW-2644)]|nr:hypothetical protein V502_02630 [Pseudogymnoascus sp. VKM F-4520 (FW-2644)]
MGLNAGLSMPFEGVPHLRTLTAWPDQAPQKSSDILKGAEADVAAIANAIVKFEPVTLFCKASNIERAKKLVSPAVEIQELEITALWIRDTGPVYVKNATGELVGLDFNFNYWGYKYEGPDGTVASSILSNGGIERIQVPFVAEGGGIEVDGEGTLILTESSVINDNRNPGATKQELEQHLKAMLGVDKVIWLNGVKDRDITDWHIDAMARFVAPGRILLSRPPEGSEQFLMDVYENAKSVLATETDAKGRNIEVLELEEADPQLFDGDPYGMALSYVNYVLVNGGVVVPSFGDVAADERAVELFKNLFPSREVVSVQLSMLRKLGGGIHCATQQQPRV